MFRTGLEGTTFNFRQLIGVSDLAVLGSTTGYKACFSVRWATISTALAVAAGGLGDLVTLVDVVKDPHVVLHGDGVFFTHLSMAV